MTLIIPPGYAQAAFRWRLTGDLEQMICTLGFNPLPTEDAPFLATALFAAATSSGSAWAASNTCTGYAIQGVTVTKMEDDGPVVAEHNQVINGTATGATLPNNCAILVQKRTALGGRRHRGRMYVPPFNVGETSVNGLGGLPESVAEIQTEYNNLMSAFVAIDLRPVILHSLSGVLPTPVQQFVVSDRIATQRRRLRG